MTKTNPIDGVMFWTDRREYKKIDLHLIMTLEFFGREKHIHKKVVLLSNQIQNTHSLYL